MGTAPRGPRSKVRKILDTTHPPNRHVEVIAPSGRQRRRYGRDSV